MKAKELGKSYLVVFCKGCQAGFRVKEDAVPEGSKIQIAAAQTLRCPKCKHQDTYQPAEIRIAKFQTEGLGQRRGG